MTSRTDTEYSRTFDKYQKQSYKHIQEQPTTVYQYNPWDFENPWAHGFCNLTEYCEETCYGLWCLPCFICQIGWRMHESCWLTFCLPGHLAVLRTKMRTAFRIEGSYFSDFCAAECCPLCVVIQMASELRLRKLMN